MLETDNTPTCEVTPIKTTMNGYCDPIIDIRDVTTGFAGTLIHQHLNLQVAQGEILAIVGGSGSGKTTLLNCLLMLIEPLQGSVHLFGQNMTTASHQIRQNIRKRWGMLFQNGALFSELTVLQNTLLPMQLNTTLAYPDMVELARMKIAMAELPADAADKYPAELSGGMVKRAALARAIALDPQLLFLDEPSAGLDPISASALDRMIMQLRQTMNLTIVLVTHDLDTLAIVPDRIAFLGEQRVLQAGTLPELLHSDQPLIRDYFNNTRAKRTFEHLT